MTLDELMKVYDKAASDVAFLQYEGPDHRAGIRAVVEALRDEIDIATDRIEALEGEVTRLEDSLESWADKYAVEKARAERLRAALEEIANGRYSGLLLMSNPPQDPAVRRAREALEDSE